MPPIAFVVDRREAGKTLAAVLKIRFGLSWSQAKRLVEGEHVKVSGQVESDVARRLKLGSEWNWSREPWRRNQVPRHRKR